MKTTFLKEEFYFDNQCIENRIISFSKKPNAEKLVFVPNWRAKEKHWTKFVDTLSEYYAVDYFETREKTNTRFKQEKIDFTVPKMSEDLVEYLNQIEGDYHLVGASIGACTIIKGWESIKNKPKSLSLICPVINLNMPKYFRLFKYIPEQFLKVVRPLIFKALSSSKQLKAVSKNLYQAFKDPDISELLLIKASIQDLIKMKISIEEVKAIQHPSFVLYTLDDGIHLEHDAQAVIQNINGAQCATMENFRAVHSKESASMVINWIQMANHQNIQGLNSMSFGRSA